MDEKIKYVKLTSFSSFNTDLNENLMSDLNLYSSYRIENEMYEDDCRMDQTVYVPEDEDEFYKAWKSRIEEELVKSDCNKILVRRIARKHRLYVKT